MGYVNKWLTPYQRSFSAIKEKLIEGLTQLKDDKGNPLITDYSEGNILVLIISLFSAIAEVIHYYIDNMARESFFSSCRRYDSLIKHANFVDYRPHGATAARVDVMLMASQPVTQEVMIEPSTEFTDRNGNKWLPDLKETLRWDLSKSQLIGLSLIQHSNLAIDNPGTIPNVTDGEPIRIIITPPSEGYLEHNSINTLTVGSVTYTRVDTFAYSKPQDNHFLCYFDTNTGNTIIQFGDGIYGSKPQEGATIGTINCFVTKGLEGNIEADGITFVPNQLGINNIVITCTNPKPAGSGSNGEGFSEVKRHVPQSVRTMGVAITKQDFQDLAELFPGVDQGVVEYECGRKVNIYIKPLQSEVSSAKLCQDLYDHIIQHCPITTWISVSSVRDIQLHLSMEVTGRKGYKSADILKSIQDALKAKFYLMKIGDNIRISDIYALIDNLPMVDYLHISEFYANPQVEIVYGNTPLIIQKFTLNRIKGEKKILVQFIDSQKFIMYPLNTQGEKVVPVEGDTVGVINYQDSESNFNIQFSSGYSYDSRYRYILTIAEPNMDMVNTGHDIPTMDVDNANIIINEVL